MIECPDDFLPLGSVVVVRGNPKKLLVVGRALVFEQDDGERVYYDYSLVPYPEGLIRDTVLYTNHEFIEEVVFSGYSDESNEEAVGVLREVLPKIDIARGNPQPQDEW